MKRISFMFCLIVTYMLQAQNIPFNPDVIYGKLDNGLTYYIEENAKPEKKVELRLAINAGSILEDEDQLGLAHFMEHMNFNGTKNFPGNELVDNLQRIGVRFGQHLNAYTSFDETVYILPIPLEKPENLDIGMQILEDWAFNAILSDEEINKERGVVLEELRLGLGADKRMLDKYLPMTLYNSHYAERLPIGKKEIIENFDPEVIRRFHKEWYRPDLMAVVVVGDIDAKDIEQRIKKQFGKYKNPESPRPRNSFEVPNHDETLVAITSDPEAQFSKVQVYYKDIDEPKKVKTEADYKKMLVRFLYSNMINNRFNEISNGANPPFTYAYAYHGSTWARTKSAYQSSAMTPEGKQLDALKVLLEENKRIEQFGFNESELERAKTELLSSIERAYNDREKTESNRKIMEYVYHFLEEEPVPGVAWEYQKYQELLPTITIDEVNELIKDYIRDENRVVVLTGPEKEGLTQPTEDEVLAVFDEVEKLDIQPYDDSVKITKLVTQLPNEGSIVNTTVDKELGTTTWTLSNGAKVTYKKTDFKNDEILFKAKRLGGNSTLSDEVYNKTKWAYSALSEAGLNGYSKTDLEKYLSGKQVNVSPFFASVSEGFNGNSTPKDLETLFELIYANFTGLNKDEEAFQSYVSKQSNIYNNLASQPRIYFLIEHTKFVLGENPRVDNLIPLQEDWDKTDYDLAYKVFTDKLSNAGDFNFIFIGNVDEDKLKEYSKKYIATLPSKGEAETYKDLGYRRINGTHEKEYKKGSDPKSYVDMRFYGETEYSAEEDLAMSALAEVIGIKLIEKLREDESGTYTSSVSGNISEVPYGNYSFKVFFPCGPENVERLIQVTEDEIKRVIENGPDAEDLAKFKEAEINEYKENIEKNRTWLNVISGEMTKEGRKERYLQFLDNLNKLSAEDVQNVAKKYLSSDYVLGVLYPEKVVAVDEKQDVVKVATVVTKDEVLNKYYEAIGGKDKFKDANAAMITSNMVMSGMNMEMKQYELDHNKFKSVISVMGQEIITVVNGDKGYKMQGGQKMDLTEAEIAQTKENSIIDTVILPDEEIKNAVEAKEVDGKTFLILNSDSDTFTFEAETGFLVERTSSSQPSAGNAKFKEWKEFDGVYYPTKIELQISGNNIEQNIQEFKLNKDVDASMFE